MMLKEQVEGLGLCEGTGKALTLWKDGQGMSNQSMMYAKACR